MNDQDRRARLLWLVLPLAAFVLLAGLVGHLPASQALSPAAAGVTKTVDPAFVEPGQTPAPLYTVTFSNPATTTLILDWITDTLPAGFLFVGMDPSSGWLQPPVDTAEPEIVWQGPITVPATSTLSLVYAVYVPAGIPRSTVPYVNSVIATAGETTIGPATAGLLVGGPDLAVTKTASPTRLLPGQTTDYTVTFANSGELTGTLAVISDTLDPSLTFVQMLPGSDVTDLPVQVGDTLVWTGPFTLPVASRPGAQLPGRYLDRARLALAVQRGRSPRRRRAGGSGLACVEVGPEKASVYLPADLQERPLGAVHHRQERHPHRGGRCARPGGDLHRDDRQRGRQAGQAGGSGRHPARPGSPTWTWRPAATSSPTRPAPPG